MNGHRRRRQAARPKVRICYVAGDTVIEYVSRTPPELRLELSKVYKGCSDGARMLSRMARIRHPVISVAYVQLINLVRSLPENASDKEIADEVARISYVMEQTVELLSTLSNSRIPLLQEARFALTYGQTPKKREPPVRHGKRHNDNDNEEETNDWSD